MIQVENLTKDYGARRAVDGISFGASRGEILGFLGPNGAGKTTTMRILSGYMPPTSGQASIAGFDVVDQSLEARRHIGYLPESVPLYPDMTIFDYLKYMADLRGVKNAASRVHDVIEMVKMEDRTHSFIEKLSKGMRQRVGIAQALLHEPDVLILDEPSLGLDPAQIRGVREVIVEVGKEHTVLLSTHILAEAQQICDRVLIINQGKIVAEDSPENLEARLSGAQRVSLRVAGDAAALVSKLEKVQGVDSVTLVEDDKIEVFSKIGQEVRPSLAKAVVEANLGLLELRPVGMSLEDIFLELTQNEEAASPEAEVDDA